tara:strand:+ start:196 stop:498 length:303 start_codon:yes stop_codon:yes gene_type:complete
MLNKIKKNFFLLTSIFLLIFFLFNLLGGERGVFSYFKKNKILINLMDEEKKLIDKISDIEFKNLLLTEKLDLDFIETLIREKFLYGKKNETLYIIENYDN